MNDILTLSNCHTFKGMMMHFKTLQQEKKVASKIERPLGFDERAPLSAFSPGMEVTGVVISMTGFGVYVDVGTECDGLLHISQITRDFFVEHPRQVFTPGDEITVKVRSTSTELKKMQLTMLNVEADQIEDDDGEERIPLNEIEADDELWGVLKRVTDYGAFVEVGAEVDGFLHFMDHPAWENGSHPSEFMKRGQRVRVWVVDVDREQRRVKLTGNRPTHLPGPRVEF
jgi:small subunit ribosomal protein S1